MTRALRTLAPVLAGLALLVAAITPAHAQSIDPIARGLAASAIRAGGTTNCASVASLCLNLQNPSGTTVFSVDKTGVIAGTTLSLSGSSVRTSAAAMTLGQGNTSQLGFQPNLVGIRSDNGFGFASTTNPAGTIDLSLFRDAANTLAQRNGVNAQKECWANTWTDGSNYEYFCIDWQSVANTAIIGTYKAGTGTARALDFAVGGTVDWQINTSGNLTSLNAGATMFLKPTTVSALPSASASGAGARATVNDATACTFGSAPTGGGSTLCPVYSDGTTWKAG